MMWTAIIGVFGTLFVQEAVVERQNNSMINPAVNPAIRLIEQQVQRNYDLAQRQGKDPGVVLLRRELWLYRELNETREKPKYADEYYDELRGGGLLAKHRFAQRSIARSHGRET